MSTTTADVREEHLSKEEIEKLAHPKRPSAKGRRSLVLCGMAASSCTASSPSTGWSSPRFPPKGRAPSSSRALRRSITTGRVLGTNNFGRSLINSLIVAGTDDPDLLFGIIGRTRSLG